MGFGPKQRPPFTLEDLYNIKLTGWVEAKSKLGRVVVHLAGGGLGQIDVQKKMIAERLEGTGRAVPADFKWGAASATPTFRTTFPSPDDRTMLPPGEHEDDGPPGDITISSEVLGKWALSLPGTIFKYPKDKDKVLEIAGNVTFSFDDLPVTA